MVDIELRLDSISRYGSAVFGTLGLESKWYVMRSLKDPLHEFRPEIDRIQNPTGIDATGYERGKVFKSTEEATRYVRAVVQFDKFVWFISEFFGRDNSVPVELKRKAVRDYKSEIEQEGLREVLEGIPGLEDVVRFLDMSPEDVASELWRTHLADKS